MPIVKCTKCQKEMTIDEPTSEAYITEGLIITRDDEGTPTNIDDSNKKISHVLCAE